MINETALQESLVAAFEYLKLHYGVLSTLMTETAALRETLKEAGGEKFAAVFERHQMEQMTKTAGVESLSNTLYDAAIQKVRASVVP